VRKTYGDTVEELAAKLKKSQVLESTQNFVDTAKEYNDAVSRHRQEKGLGYLKWDPSAEDGLSTQSSSKTLRIPKPNWALPLAKGPFMAINICYDITFTFGDLAVDPKTSGVISNATGKAIPGVYCCGEMVGGLFYEKYPGSSGLTSGATFGRRAGIQAATMVSNLKEMVICQRLPRLRPDCIKAPLR
jgi:predicted oxidoreductase